MKWTTLVDYRNQKRKDRGPFRWFAWHPIRIQTQRVWLEYVIKEEIWEESYIVRPGGLYLKRTNYSFDKS